MDDGTAQSEKGIDEQVTLRLLKRRTIILTGEINRESGQRVTAQLLLLAEEAPDKPVKVFINSPGGDVDAGFAIFDVARFIPSPVEMVVAGLAASAAVIVLLASPKERRFSLPNARFLIHQPSTGVRGDASDIQIEASEIIKSREKINKLMAEETGQDITKIETDTKRNFWMNAEESLKYGLVGKIVANYGDI